MLLTILIPAYNEAESISQVIESMPREMESIDVIQVMVVDDGSKDRTAEMAEQAGAIVVSHNYNRGVGAAFKTGLEKALELGADLMVNIDADGQFSPDDIPLMIKPILDGKADFVSGDRFTDANGKLVKPEFMSGVKFWGNRQMSNLISRIVGKDYPDVSCGFRAYSKEAMLRLNLTGQFTYTQESFLDLANKGMVIRTLPVSIKYFPERKSRVAGSIFKYFVNTIKIIIRAYRDYQPMRFFGLLGLLPFIIAFGCGIFTLVHYIQTGAFSPYKVVGFVGIYLLSLAILLWIAGLLADMFVRIRKNEEQLLYYDRKNRYYPVD
ncbi:MAG: glycosyltransferase family 2 protein [Anaerolineaceae bacterium]